jgi:sugar phosphate isomerase/epimerase
MFVQALIAKRAVEALDVGVLDRFAGPNAAERDAALIRLRVARAARKLGTVVQDDPLWHPDRRREPLKDAHDARPWQRPIDLNRQTLARAVVSRRRC